MKSLIYALILAPGLVMAQGTQTTTTAAPANGAGAIVTPAPTQPGKTLSFSATSLTEVNRTDVDLKSENLPVMTTNYLGAKQKLSGGSSVAARFYWQHGFNQEKAGSKETISTYRTLDPRLLYTVNMPKFSMFEEAPVTFWYYIPVTDSSKNSAQAFFDKSSNSIVNDNAKTDYVRRTQSMGTLRVDGELDVAVTPLLTVGYYYNPRLKLYTNNESNQAILIHYLLARYNVMGDKAAVYAMAGQTNTWVNVDTFGLSTTAQETAELSLGAYFSLMGGKLYINPEVSNSIVTKSHMASLPGASQKVGDFQAFRSDELTYALTVGLTL